MEPMIADPPTPVDLTTDEKLDVILETLTRVDDLLEKFAPALELLEQKMVRKASRGALLGFTTGAR